MDNRETVPLAPHPAAADEAIAQALRSSRSYRLAAEVPVTDACGPSTYDIWGEK